MPRRSSRPHGEAGRLGRLHVPHPGRRAIVVMHELEGLTPRAIASLLGLSALTVRWHLSMARRD